MKLDELKDQMFEAANNAKHWSNEYNVRSGELKRLGQSDIERDDDHFLKKYYNRYCFWRDEQNRLANLLQAWNAYYQLKKTGFMEEDLVYKKAQQLLDKGIMPTKERIYNA